MSFPIENGAFPFARGSTKELHVWPGVQYGVERGATEDFEKVHPALRELAEIVSYILEAPSYIRNV